ncbi:hypothetical protein [Bradyrhizobium sp. Tv2a-2]|uniref:hypothetical protein n=1 Tax=Bradyrhizobium sp. Tv2a-2 TaxID=113395 RepID=UPI0004647843|nr:hypothetical protein [Bradyrhizobium sp. Tv2a-2]
MLIVRGKTFGQLGAISSFDEPEILSHSKNQEGALADRVHIGDPSCAIRLVGRLERVAMAARVLEFNAAYPFRPNANALASPVKVRGTISPENLKPKYVCFCD